MAAIIKHYSLRLITYVKAVLSLTLAKDELFSFLVDSLLVKKEFVSNAAVCSAKCCVIMSYSYVILSKSLDQTN